MSGQPYDDVDWSLNYRAHQDEYVIGRGEFGVLKYQPYKSEILPNWQYKNAEVAEASAEAIWEQFEAYLDAGDFPGADMARKYLQMGFTRAMRYAKYPGGKKYDKYGNEREQQTWADPEKREAAVIYKEYWDRAREHPAYIRQKDAHESDRTSVQTGLESVTAD